ncbi:MAG: hypothetical protein JWL72_1640 [Ilumatobacteraceae bacterium]|nr:hypothetical protein [Ilumatobacteraceae bacterium]MCU1393194.1 hypothetical protein [Ilumatobacteraceae bacterium]
MSDQPTAAYEGRELAVIDAFVHLSDTLVDDYDVIEFLTYLAEQCCDLSVADEAAVMLAAPSGHLHAVASSSERSRMLELFELQNQDGPCLDAYRSGVVVASGNLEAEPQRWPIFIPQALKVGYRAVHSVPLKLRNEVIGALNLLRLGVGTFPDADARLVGALSDIATVGVLQERNLARSISAASGLQTALTSRIRIEQAKGVLGERWAVPLDEAFEHLRRYARRRGLRLTEVAEGVVRRTISIPAPDE